MNPPPPVPESETNNADGTPAPAYSDPDCPFCTIISNYPPISPLSSTLQLDNALDPSKLDPPAFVLLSTADVVAFFDVYPLTRGHVLVCPRRHAEKVGDLSGKEGCEIGRLLPLLTRAITGACMPDIPHASADYNVVQNNGPGAAQVIPHAHFHVVPRYPFDYVPPPLHLSGTSMSTGMGQHRSEPQGHGYEYGRRHEHGHGHGHQQRTQSRKSGGEYTGFGTVKPSSSVPEGWEATKILFGRGQRHYRDDEEAEGLVKVMRERVRAEWGRELGGMEVEVGRRGVEMGMGVGRGGEREWEMGREREREVSMRGGSGGGSGGGKL